MKIAVISDIHSNFVALRTCLEYIRKQKVSGILYLGDFISDCPYPEKTMEFVRESMKEFKTWCVRGNREDYMLNHRNNPKDGWNQSTSTGSLLYTYERLSESDLNFFQELNIVKKVHIDNFPPIIICHGSPNASREQLFKDSEVTREYLTNIEADYLLAGHTHAQESLEYNGKKFINPGSLGIPIGSGGKAQFAILHGLEDQWKEEFIHLEYNVDKMITAIDQSELCSMAFIMTKIVQMELKTGINYLEKCLIIIHSLMNTDNYNSESLGIPEKYWVEAAKSLNLIE